VKLCHTCDFSRNTYSRTGMRMAQVPMTTRNAKVTTFNATCSVTGIPCQHYATGCRQHVGLNGAQRSDDISETTRAESCTHASTASRL
jgi:hypothetical protein